MPDVADAIFTPLLLLKRRKIFCPDYCLLASAMLMILPPLRHFDTLPYFTPPCHAATLRCLPMPHADDTRAAADDAYFSLRGAYAIRARYRYIAPKKSVCYAHMRIITAQQSRTRARQAPRVTKGTTASC